MKFIISIFFVLLLITNSFATHNRAGEITYKQVSGYTFDITVITFTNTKPTSNGTRPADRSSLPVVWGDDTYSIVDRNIYYDLPDYYRKNIYMARHTFPGPGTYEIYVEDPNRNEGVENIPNSVYVVFSIRTILQINAILGINNTPYLLNPPVDKAATHQKFIHNPSAFDPDGDSISYELTVCTGENGLPISNYTFPESSNIPIYIDPIKGDLVWDSPTKAGIYNVAFFIDEWRKGIKIGKITRDMQIEVFDSDNAPPVIDSIPPLCAIAGETIEFIVTAHDSAYEEISLSASGGVFLVDSAAQFKSTPAKGAVTGTFTWGTQCLHIRKEPYQVVFKATDNNSEVNLVDQKTTEITIVGPAPANLSASAGNNAILLNWNSYACANATGFNIYRSNMHYGFTPDKCQTGVPLYTGYEKIASISDALSTEYLDNNNGDGLVQGYTYCYIITATFANDVESRASEEICTELERGTPIITHVSVSKHHSSEGEIYIDWSKPIELDTIFYPGPYKYIIKRAQGIWGTQFISIDSLTSLNDTIYIDKNINTIDYAYAYKIEIHNANGLTEQPMTASSVYPKIDGSNSAIQLSFLHNTPWINHEYTIFRQNESTQNFDSIGISNSETYTDTGLLNQNTYCYRVKSTGSYQLGGIINPIINFSHQNCGMPIDTVPPEPLSLEVTSNCITFINTLVWQPVSNPNEISKYNIYFSPLAQGEFKLIDSVLNADSTRFDHILLDYPSGCYAVTAVDTNQNEGKLSNKVCVDNCSFYELPNVFTPNNDNINDLYIPITPPFIIERFIEKVDFRVYSRWGNMVFKTTDPLLNWDGKNSNSNNKVSPGVYYYVCDISEKRISGIEHRNIVGFIHVFYNKENQNNE